MIDATDGARLEPQTHPAVPSTIYSRLVSPKGPVWGAASEELNATKLVWPAGEQLVEHVSDRDVAYVVLAGSLTLTVDDVPHELSAGDALIVEHGARRALGAGDAGVEYVTVHRRRGGLQIRALAE
jgi:quercetin dioxygenase-like cupin family protein